MPDQTGSAQIHAQARPDLCWQAAGNGSPVTLEHCDGVNGQQWSLTGNGVLMNGNGYCLQAGPSLLVGFDGQCDGGAGQVWTFSGASGQLAAGGRCAVLNEPLAPGVPVVNGACHGGTRWNLGATVVIHPVPATPRAAPPRAAARPATVHVTAAPPVTAAGTGWTGSPLAALLAGLLLVTVVTLVLFGRRSRAAQTAAGRPRPGGPDGGPGRGPDRGAAAPVDDGPYVTDEVARRRTAHEVVDARPTAPFDLRSLS